MTGPLLLYDGDCALCSRSVRSALRWDRKGTLRFAALTGATAAALLSSAPAEVRTADSLVWITTTGVGAERPPFAIRSDAAIALWHYLGGGWGVLAGVASLFPARWRDAVYDVVARHRIRWFGTADRCALPPAADRPRFPDLAR